MNAAGAGFLPVWLVDARDIALAFGASVPGFGCPSWVMGAMWSAFTVQWLRRLVFPVVLHLRNAVQGYPDTHTDAVYFAVEDPFKDVLRRNGGDLAGVPSTGANGRATTLRDFMIVASRLETLSHQRVALKYLSADGESHEHVNRSVYAPFSVAPPHTLDLPPWVANTAGVQQLQDRTYAAHKKRMAARRSQ